MYMCGQTWRIVWALPLPVFPPCVSAKSTIFLHSRRTKITQGPLFGRIFSGTSDAENPNKKGSQSNSQRGANAHFNRLVDEPSYEFADHGGLKGHEDV